MSTTWYAQLAAQNWTAVHQWNTAADGSASYGTPAPGDTCDLNGKTVNVDFITSLGGTINVQDTPGTGLLNFNTDITNTDTWVCSCNIQVIGGATGGATGYVTLTNLSLLGNSLYESEGTTQNVNIGLVDGSLCPTLTILGTLAFPTDFFLGLSLYITVYSDAALDLTATTFSGTGRYATLTVWNAFSARANANYTEYGCMPQLEPSGYAEYLTGSGGYTVSASPVYFADPSEVALGIDRGDGTPGTRTDCPADEALTTAIYGSPYAYFTGTVSLPEETEVVAGVTFGDSDSLTGSYPTSATTAAAQLATDVAAVTAAEAGITTATTILGVTGTLDMTTYVLKTDVVSPSYVVVGNNNYVGGSAGTYPTSATTAAAQLATDVAAVTAAEAGITTATTILGVTGTLDMTLYTLISAVVSPSYVVAGHENYSSGSAGTYPTSATTAAAQLATDVAAVTAAEAGITTATTILGVTGTLDLANYVLITALPPVGDVLSGVDRGDGQYGTRTDCTAADATTAASYGDPGNPITGTLDLANYVLKSSVVSASQVLVGVATYPGGPDGTFGGLTAVQITQLISTIDGLCDSYPTVAQIAAAMLSDPSAPIQVDAQGFVRFFYSPQPQIVYTMPGNLACSRADVENVFGAENVQKWADVDNCGDPTVIARRIDWSIAWATNELQDLLRDGPYVVDPLPVTAAATWVPLAAMLAGWMLSNPRVGEDSVDPAKQRKNSWALTHVQQTVHEIKIGKRRINAMPARRMANVPMVMP